MTVVLKECLLVVASILKFAMSILELMFRADFLLFSEAILPMLLAWCHEDVGA